MGNSYSDIKSTFSQKQRIPKHLKPMNSKRKKKRQQMSAKEAGSASPTPPARANDLFVVNSKGDKVVNEGIKAPVVLPKAPKVLIYGDDSDFADEETVLVGSGPRGAFRWFKGRRYLNYATKGGLDNTLLPNDQIELDRMRVLSFIIRWAFKGNVIAPVEEQLKTGIKVLNVGFGPGMWTGHHTIDMAMDYPNSHFTTVDVCDLLPEDFEAEAAAASGSSAYNVDPHIANNKKDEEKENSAPAITAPTPITTTTTATKAPNTVVNNMTLFTPMHPNLSVKLQNTTTPVIDSSTLDSTGSSFLLSQIEEVRTKDERQNSSFAASTTTTTTTMSTMSDDEEEEADETTPYRSQFTADKTYIKQMEAPGETKVTPVMKHRKLLPNLEFYQVNVIDAKLPFKDNSFGFVKQRLATASFTIANWKCVISELVRVTKPGGYIQLLEIDYNTFNLGPKGRKWEIHLLETARLKRQMEPRMARHLPDILKAVGLIDVSSKLVSIPLGSWGLDLGNLWKHNMEMFVEATCPLLSKLAGVSPTEYKAQWRDMFEEVKDQKPFSNIHAAWGRKSFTAPSNLDNTTIDWSSVPPML